MKNRLYFVIMSVLIIMLLAGCGKKEQSVESEVAVNTEEEATEQKVAENEEGSPEQEAAADTEDTKRQEVLDTQVETLNVKLKIPHTWNSEENDGLSVNFEGGVLRIYAKPVERKMSVEELANTYTEEPNGIIEKIFNGREEMIAGQTMYVFDYTAKSNEKDLYGTVYQFSTDYEHYTVQFAFFTGYDYKETMTQIMESFELVPYASEEEKAASDLEYPIGDAEKCLNGKVKEQKVYLQGVVEGVKYDKVLEETEFSIWYKRGESYYKDSSVAISDEDMKTYNIPNLKEGETYYFLCDIYKDGSFGVHDEYSIIADKNGDTLKKVYSKYRKACKAVTSKSLMRSPKKNKFKMVKFSGRVLQIVNRKYQLEFLLSLDDGTLINVVYDGKGQKKILEDDQITIYGEYLCNYSYETVLRSNKEVARINAAIVDR